jgi:BetI-type transcriptional repressor, C-terminal
MYRVCFLDGDPEAPPWSFWLELWGKAARTPKLRQYHSQHYSSLHDNQTRHARAGIEAGQIKPDLDPELVAELYHTLIYGLAVKVTLDNEAVSPERAFEIGNFALSLVRSEDAEPGPKRRSRRTQTIPEA